MTSQPGKSSLQSWLWPMWMRVRYGKHIAPGTWSRGSDFGRDLWKRMKAAKGERFIVTPEAPNNDVYGPERRYGVIDRENDGGWAMLPDATLCWGMTHDRALDALIELRGGMRAER